MSEPLFIVENLKIAYPHHDLNQPLEWAVNDVSFQLHPGDKLGLVGESGCGKSTLGRAALSLLPSGTKIEGCIKYNGESIFSLSASELRKFRGEVVGLVFQDPMTRLDPLMTIGDHCLETLKAHQPDLSYSQAKEKVLTTLATVKIPLTRWQQYAHEFSGGMRQRVAIALALLLEPKLIIADEPTTSLDVTIAAEILQELTRLSQERQMGLILISHDLAMVGEYCDRLAVMYQGQMVESGSVKTIFHQPQHSYTRSLLQSALHLQVQEDHQDLLPKNTLFNSQILQVKNLIKNYTLESNFLEQIWSKETKVIQAVDNVSFDLYQGEILGLVGESGCGKSTLSRTILQLIRATEGTINFQGQDLTKLSEKEMRAIRRQMQMIFQDPHACLNPLMKVGENIIEPLLIHQICTPKEAKIKVKEMLARVELNPVEDYYNRYPKELSGGQQQRVAIARALITQPKLIICDEPVSMLDASIQAQVLELMLELKAEFNLTYLFITHDLLVARFLCDRIAVMNRGKIVEMDLTETIFTSPKDDYTKKLLTAAPMITEL